MLHELLPDVPGVVLRPSIVLGDSRFPETTQFDMVRAFVMLAQMRVLPFKPDWRLDIVPADYVSKAIVHIHQVDKPKYDSYNLSSGTSSLTFREIVENLEAQGHPVRHRFAPWLNGTFTRTVDAAANTPRNWGLSLPASLLKVFLPYLTFNTVFDNRRVVEELGEAPRPFNEYALGLLRFARNGNFNYPYLPWPGGAQVRQVA